ncbi:putative Ig domain-containing protein [Mucilaginibacter mali]|uniref:Putative Ig domain-containing protein n=1 Tax=Mucilaginibacter mali TaxID=2740462 RepID=A0A7D4UGZ5_9SPHI|nr:DUF6443 domain-containing protein [Mucilaginibacter mali]QKJ32456.1 putative Ig domain-containing protein [Mucilaginibacter mali]
MKTNNLIKYGMSLVLLIFSTRQASAQVPTISYAGSQSYTIGAAISPLSPTVSGTVFTMGQTSTFAGSGSVGSSNGTGTGATFNHPIGVVADASGNVYVADRLNYNIRKITPSGVVTLLAGSTSSTFANGTGTSASFALPNDIALDGSGNLYVADEWNNMVRKVTPSGVVTTFAGSTTSGFTNANGASARFSYPFGICSDAAGNLYVADLNNGAVRKITPSGDVTTLASGFGTVLDVACDAAGYVYVADANYHTIYKITPSGTTSIFAGAGYAGSSNGTGNGATFNHPAGIAVDGSGNVYVGDENNQQIRKITPAGVVTTVAGTGSSGSSNGSGSSSSFYLPCGVAYDQTTGSLFVADYNNNMIRKVVVTPYSISPALPAGLVFDNATGIISGTPTAMTTPTVYTVTAYNSSGGGTTTVTISTGTGISSPSNENFILTYTPRTEISDNTLLASSSVGNVNQSITYFDGLGRPMQSVELKGNGDGTKDLIQPIAYDEYGREVKKYLPYTTAAGDALSYRSNALTSGYGVDHFYNPTGATSGTQQLDGSGTPIGVVNIPYPYAQTRFEASPLSRAVEQGAPGDAWQLSTSGVTGSGHTVRMQYGLNTDADELNKVLLWAINTSGGATTNSSSRYVAGQLHKTITTDENGNNTIAFTDKIGNVVCKKVQLGIGVYLSTYYVYDDYNNLTYVIPPIPDRETYPTSFTEASTDAIFNNYIYAYHYDNRSRLTERKMPNKGWEHLVYNNTDQVVATQDAVQRGSNKYTFTKYDAQGRVIMTGELTDTRGHQQITNDIITQAVNWETPNSGYTDGYTTGGSWPTSWNMLYTVNYYDNYDFPGSSTTGYGPTVSPGAKATGLLTGKKVRNLVSGSMLLTVNYYDDKGRPLEVIAQNNIGGTDRIVSVYNFTGQPTQIVRTHNSVRSGSSLTNFAITNQYLYDHLGRKTQTKQQTGSGADMIVLNQLDYNETGQLFTKHLYKPFGGTSFFQDVKYSYNERGWLQGSNAGLFAMRLKYNDADDGAAAQFNGNIGNQYWGLPGNLDKHYSYNYDALNRIISGITNTGFSEQGPTTQGIEYDYLGNIIKLKRVDPVASTTGNYVYSYLGNQLQTVTGLTGSAYHYDENGNPDHDGRTGRNITYNYLNLPQTANMPYNTQTITYTYDATGKKLKRESSTPGVGTTDYDNGIVYENSTIFAQTEDGRVINLGGSVNYEYNLSDNLRNTRVTFDTSLGYARIVQRDDYFPFGMQHASPTGPGSPPNNYLYNEKELQVESGQYDYGARFYDPVIARWTTIDPLAEQGRRWSPYSYVSDNPIRYIDPDGMSQRDYALNSLGPTASDDSEDPIAAHYEGAEAQEIARQLQVGQSQNDGGKGTGKSKPPVPSKIKPAPRDGTKPVNFKIKPIEDEPDFTVLDGIGTVYGLGSEIKPSIFKHGDAMDWLILGAKISKTRNKAQAISVIQEFLIEKGITAAFGGATPYAVASMVYSYYENTSSGTAQMALNYYDEINYDLAQYDATKDFGWKLKAERDNELYHEYVDKFLKSLEKKK